MSLLIALNKVKDLQMMRSSYKIYSLIGRLHKGKFNLCEIPKGIAEVVDFLQNYGCLQADMELFFE